MQRTTAARSHLPTRRVFPRPSAARRRHATTMSMYHRGTFPPPPIAPPVPLSPLPAPLPLLWNLPPVLPPLTQLPPSAPPLNVGVDLFGVILLLVCVVNTLFTVIILYYTVRSLCHRRVKRPVPGGNYPPVSVLVPCYLPNEQVRTTRTPPAHCPHTPHRARLASEVRLPPDRVAGHHHGLHRIPNPNPSPSPKPKPKPNQRWQGIIMGTIAHILKRIDYPAPITLYIVYNTPSDLPAIEADLAALEPIQFEGGRRVCVLRASDSRSKADTLNPNPNP